MARKKQTDEFQDVDEDEFVEPEVVEQKKAEAHTEAVKEAAKAEVLARREVLMEAKNRKDDDMAKAELANKESARLAEEKKAHEDDDVKADYLAFGTRIASAVSKFDKPNLSSRSMLLMPEFWAAVVEELGK